MASQVEKRAGALRDFVDSHPDGWHHGDWERLAEDLRSRGLLAPGQEESMGRELERMRVRKTLEGLRVSGLGPKRRETIAEAFGHLWDLRNATAEEVAALPGMNRRIAADVVAALH